jgi:hypothetical protein
MGGGIELEVQTKEAPSGIFRLPQYLQSAAAPLRNSSPLWAVLIANVLKSNIDLQIESGEYILGEGARRKQQIVAWADTRSLRFPSG